MMAAFRAFAKSPAAAVLMGVLIISFGVWGVRDVFHVRISDAVVKAGSREILSADFKQKFQQQLKSVQQQTGQAVTTEEAVRGGVVQKLLEDLSSEEAVQEAVRRSGVHPSDKLVIDQIRKIPAFFNPVTGAFDERTFEQLLDQNGLTPTQFQQDLTDQLAMLHFTTGMVAGLKVPATYAVLLGALDQQGRAADYFLIDAKSVPAPTKPTDAQLTGFMAANADRLRQPESRQISLVRISAQALAPGLHPSEADVRKMFNVDKARLSAAERRSFVQIPAKDPTQAAAIAARLTNGEDASAVAKSYGVKPLSFADVPQATVTDPAVGQAVFALKPGQVSGPIRGQFGLAVAKLVSITPAKAATLEEARPQIEKELNDKASKDMAYDQSEKYSDAHNKGQNMDAAAKAANLRVFVIPVPFNAQGKMPDGKPLPIINDKMLKEAFSLPQGGETDITDLGAGEYYALRVDKVTAAHAPTLEQIRQPLTQVFMQQALGAALKAKADGLVQAVKKGQAMAAAAASAGAKLEHLDTTRASAQALQQAVGAGILTGVFESGPGAVFDTRGPGANLAVVKLTGFRAGAPADIAKDSTVLRTQMSEQMGRSDLGEMFYAAARAKVRPKIDLALAYQAIGAQPPAGEGAAAPAKAPGKAQ